MKEAYGERVIDYTVLLLFNSFLKKKLRSSDLYSNYV